MKKYKIVNNKVILGRYPQTKVEDLSLIMKLNNREVINSIVNFNRKEYFLYEGDYYLIEPIEWLVININNTEALLISKCVLDSKIFDEENTSWEDSSLRKWLNNEFIKISELDKEDLIKENDYQDLVSLISKFEIEEYRLDSFETYISDYSRAKDSDYELLQYWSRTESPYNGRVISIDSWEFVNRRRGIRPVLRINVEVKEKEYGPSFIDNFKVKEMIKEGNQILFGYYPKSLVEDERLIFKLDKLNPDKDNYVLLDNSWYKKYQYIRSKKTRYFKVEPLVWKIVKEDKDSYILLADKCIDAKQYEPLYYQKRSKLMDYLNNEFIDYAFLNQKDRLIEFRSHFVNLLKIEDLDDMNQYYEDKICFFTDSDSRKASATDYAYFNYDEDVLGKEPYLFEYWLDEFQEGSQISYWTIDLNGDLSSSYYYERKMVRPFIRIKK